MPKLYYAGHARRGRLPYPEVLPQFYARRNPGRSALLNGHNASCRHHADIPIEAGCAKNDLEYKRQTPPNRTQTPSKRGPTKNSPGRPLPA
jgi:hypothetical protein